MYYFCIEHEIDNYEEWKGSGKTLDDVIEFEDKEYALEFIGVEIDDLEMANLLSNEIKNYCNWGYIKNNKNTSIFLSDSAISTLDEI